MWKITKPLSLEALHDGQHIWELPDVSHLISSEDLKSIGSNVWEGFRRDKLSRAKWEKRSQAAMDMAMQIQKGKSFPWPGCANVVFPLVSISCLQFHSRAYPSLISGTSVVKYRVIGADPKGEEAKRAERLGAHMSYQVLEEDQSWEEQHDRLFLSVPIVGCAFVKTYYCAEENANTSELVMAQDLVVDYYAKSIERAARKSQVIPVTRHELFSSVEEGRIRDIRDCVWYKEPAQEMQLVQPGQAREDVRRGQNPPLSPDEDTPYTTIEQHRRLDLDGDGYAEPWIVTIESSSKEVIRIVAGWDSDKQMEKSLYGRLSRIHSTEYYTKYELLPSPDGGVYGLGFGVLLGPLNSTVNASINQLLDAGTLQTTQGGFLARGAKIRGGQYQFNQFGWNRVDATGDDLRKSIVPMPVNQPSDVLFKLLSFIVDYTQRLGASTDALQGLNPGQNTPAQTQQSMVEQGSKIYSAIFKRMWRAMKEEFRKLYCLNATYMPEEVEFGAQGTKVLRQDYLGDPKHIAPVADPNIVSDQQLLQRAVAVKQASATTPGYDREAVERNFLSALKVDGAEALFPGADKVPPLPNPKLMEAQAKAEGQLQVVNAKAQMDLRKFAMEMAEEHRLNTAKILQLEAQAALAMEQAGGVQTGHEIAAFNAAIGALKTHNDALRGQVDQIMKAMEMNHDQQQDREASLGGGMGGMGGPSGNQGPSGATGAPTPGANG